MTKQVLRRHYDERFAEFSVYLKEVVQKHKQMLKLAEDVITFIIQSIALHQPAAAGHGRNWQEL